MLYGWGEYTLANGFDTLLLNAVGAKKISILHEKKN